MRSVLSRLLPPPWIPSAWPTPNGHVVAEHGQRRAVDAAEHLRDASPHDRPAVARRPVELGEVAPDDEPLVHPGADVAAGVAAVDAARAVLRAGDLRRASPRTDRRRSNGRLPSAAFTVRISRSSTWHVARACVMWWPSTASVTSMSSTSPGRAYVRYCAVAQIVSRRAVALEGGDGRAEAGAAVHEVARRADPGRDRQLPPEPVVGRVETEEGPGVHGPHTIAHVAPVAAPSGSARLRSPGMGDRAVVRGRLLAGRGVPGRRALCRSRSSRRRTPRSTPARSTRSATSTASTPRSPPAWPTCHSPFGGVPIAVKELERGRRVAGHPGVGRVRRPHRHDHLDDRAAGPRPRRRHPRRADHGVRVRRRQPHPHRRCTASRRNPWEPDRTPAAPPADRPQPSPAGW